MAASPLPLPACPPAADPLPPLLFALQTYAEDIISKDSVLLAACVQALATATTVCPDACKGVLVAPPEACATALKDLGPGATVGRVPVANACFAAASGAGRPGAAAALLASAAALAFAAM